MSDNDRLDATAKNIQGKAQEAWGEVTGDPKQKLEGKEKQVEASAEHAKEDLKDTAKQVIDQA